MRFDNGKSKSQIPKTNEQSMKSCITPRSPAKVNQRFGKMLLPSSGSNSQPRKIPLQNRQQADLNQHLRHQHITTKCRLTYSHRCENLICIQKGIYCNSLKPA